MDRPAGHPGREPVLLSPAVVVQRSGFAYGGATLAVTAHHALVDGPGLGALYRLWTAIAQGRPADA